MTFSQSPTVYVASSKRQITDSAERGGAKAGTLKKNGKITATASFRNADGDLRVQCARGWLTSELANGQKLLTTIDSEAQEAPKKRGLGERTSSAQNVANSPRSTSAPAKKAAPALPTDAQIAALISAVRATNPDLNIKKLAFECKAKRPDWKVGAKEVRAQIAAGALPALSAAPMACVDMAVSSAWITL